MRKPKTSILTKVELEFMHIIWERGEVNSEDMQNALAEKGRKLSDGAIRRIFAILIDKGHLTALDDPEVRSLASRYGDADELLREAWFPAIPGINVPGDYMEDYAQDPISWIKKETLEHPIWIE